MAANLEYSLNRTVYPEEIRSLPMFHWIKKDRAEAVVRKYCKTAGTYLLRPSSNIDEKHFAITLSVSSDAIIRHLRVNIEKKKGKNGTKFSYYIKSSQHFPAFLDFLKYYYVHPIECDHDIRVKLLRGLGFSNRKSTSSGRRSSEPDFIFSVGGSRAEHGRLVHRSSTPNLHNSVHTDPRPSVANLPSPPNTFSSSTQGELYHNQMAIRQRTHTDPKHRPPPPIPTSEDSNYVFDYSVVGDTVNFFDVFYEDLKKQEEQELCECGLRVMDTSLPGGWTIHKADDIVFFQRGESYTSWDIPADIAEQLTEVQLDYIFSLCKDIGCGVPGSLKKRIAVVGHQGAPQGSRGSAPSRSNSTASGSMSIETQFPYDTCEESLTDPSYEIPSPLVVPSSPFYPSTSVTSTSQLSQSCSLPSVSEDPNSTTPGHEADGESCSSSQYHPGQQVNDHSDVLSSAEGSFSTSSHLRYSFNSIPAVTIQAMSGPPSVAPRTKSLTQSCNSNLVKANFKERERFSPKLSFD